MNAKHGVRHAHSREGWREPSLLCAGGYVFASCDVAFVSTVRSSRRSHYFQVGLRSGQKIFITHICVEAANDAYGRFTSELHQALGL
ncbi:TPA: hypothetical protein QDZ34_000162 [Stenotrophomonas maltophilia]|nr:hypothetical protein [Stenotrophomonas maltophilia]HDS1024096.1 hypothetical protein [Stenotrophomonas maltophilia]HDS1028409.1 hypothetical protein [Stenotrophomonas maltophilia]HDS1032859.1 hypothetical protein [Stenotrophomonas maltophilia]